MKQYDADCIWKEEEKKMAFTWGNYWRVAGPDQLTSFVSVAHEGPVEKLPPEIGSSGGEVMECVGQSTAATFSVMLVLPFIFALQRGRCVLGCQKRFSFSFTFLW